MRERLEGYLRLCREYESAEQQSGFAYTDHMRTIDRTAEQEFPTLQRILGSLDPGLAHELVGIGYGNNNAERRIHNALGILRDREEWKVRLAPDAPSLVADQMHEVIWQAAAPLWDTGEYKMAAHAAATSLSAHVKARVGSHLNDRALVQQVFSPDLPQPGKPRLHFPGNREDDDWKSRQQGLLLIAQGAFAGIRNIAAHDDTPWTEQEALEHLAVLSVVARWADLTVEQTVQES